MNRCLLGLACAFLFLPTARSEEDKAREVVWGLFGALENGHWKSAETLFTSTATVTGIPAEDPTRRWTKTPAQFLAEKPRWNSKILDSRIVTHGDAGMVFVDFRHSHLVIRSTYHMVRIDGEWKIDAMRFSTLADAKGTQEEMKSLKGTWTYTGQKESLLRSLRLKIELDAYEWNASFLQFRLFGGGDSDEREDIHSDWRIRIDPSVTPKKIDLEWDEKGRTEGYYGIYKLEGDKLTVLFTQNPKDRPKAFDAEVPNGIAFGGKLTRQ